ncbi:MAG TPA: sulfatase-like hydrolase/transferase, partial [Gammaproteobacteria bacterium]|nr:sulfatase-like hydrolase/transferase [Gammaproteobacteria bacterium]
MTNIKSRLFKFLICLTLLFISAQLSFYFIHNHLSELFYSVSHGEILKAITYSNIYLPILFYLTIQLLAYLLFISWIWFTTIATGQLFHLPDKITYLLGIVHWFIGCVMIFLLNQYYFPTSSFSVLVTAWLPIETNRQMLFAILLAYVFANTFFAYLALFTRHLHGAVAKTGCFFLILFSILTLHTSYEKVLIGFTRFTAHEQPNIIIIGLDSLRPDFTGYFGGPQNHTPHIDHFLQEAVTFTNAYTPLARTFPAWLSILTGQYPKHHQARQNLTQPTSLAPQKTLANYLQQTGYETIYATDEKRFSNITKQYGFKRIIGPRMGINDFLLSGLSDYPLSNLLINLPIGKWLFPYNYGNRAAAITYQPDSFLQLLKSGLAHSPDKPLFLAIHLCLAHWPYTWAQAQPNNALTLPETYRQSVATLDQQFNHLLLLLENIGLLKNSWVIVLSDHGIGLGLLGDRLISKERYQGDPQQMKWVSVYKLSAASHHSLNLPRNFSINTSYGQGTDVLSLSQHRILLAMQRFGKTPNPVSSNNSSQPMLAPRKTSNLSSLLDITPTILDILNLPATQKMDGFSFKKDLYRTSFINHSRPLFIETGDRLAEIETDKISVHHVIQQQIDIYQVDHSSGLLSITSTAEKSILQAKQRAVLEGDWLLAFYPERTNYRFTPVGKNAVVGATNKLELTPVILPAYFILASLKTG